MPWRPWPPRRSRRLLTPRPLGRRRLPGTLRPSGRRRSGSGSRRRCLPDPEGDGSFEQVTLHPQPGGLALQLAQPGALIAGKSLLFATVDAVLPGPVAEGGVVDAQLPGDLGDRPAGGAHQLHRVTFELGGELPSGPVLLLSHLDTLLSSKMSCQQGEVQLRHRLGWSVQHPVRRAAERDQAAIDRWVAEDWPRIKQSAQRRRACLVFFDESALSLTPNVRRTWAPRGQPPTLTHPFNWQRASMAAAICYGVRGGGAQLCFHVQAGNYDTERLIEVLGELRKFLGGQKATVLWDGLPAHRSTAMRDWIRTQ